MIDLRKDGVSIDSAKYKNKGSINLRKQLDASDLLQQNREQFYRIQDSYRPIVYDIVASPAFHYTIEKKPKKLQCKISRFAYNIKTEKEQFLSNDIFDRFSECQIVFDYMTDNYIISGTPREPDYTGPTSITKENGETFLKYKDYYTRIN